MDRIIQPYAAPGVPTHAVAAASAPALSHSIPPKSAGDMFRAAKRGIGIVLAFTALAGAVGAAIVLRMPPVFRAVAHIQIEPPRFDHHIAIILAGNSIPTNDREASEKFVPNRMAWLQSKSLATDVLFKGQMGIGKGYESNPQAEILANVNNRRLLPGTNIFEVSLEGSESARVKELLAALLEAFRYRVRLESEESLTSAKKSSEDSIATITANIKKLDESVTSLVKAAPIFAPGGKLLPVEEYTTLKAHLLAKRGHFEDLRHEDRIAALYPSLHDNGAPTKYQKRIEYLLERKELYQERLEQAARVTRQINSDPATRHWAKLLDKALNDLDEMYKLDQPSAMPSRTELAMAHATEEIKSLDRQVKSQFEQIQETMPQYEKYQNLVREREALQLQLAEIKQKLSQFVMVAASRPDPVQIIQAPTEPSGPSKPNRPMLIGLITGLGFLLGLTLVCGREYLDRSVKVPEHLSAGLTLPILSVIPRIRRVAKLDRGGHLWTANDPLAHEADAYRNLRAGLIGTCGPKSSLVTMMITSAKSGEGKSTTALNLALTCARAGERTLLLEADLRRPSLSPVFNATEPNVGLVDVLRGDMPWQQAVIRTDIANLSFLPSGDPTGVPIEVLGTLELRQLILALSGQFQRVIIDAPAVLGLADCRMLGRTVDAAILVVRSGTHELRPLRRAKEMLEQSRVPIAGVVFNGLTDDLDNWSCLGAASLPDRSSWRPELEAPAQRDANVVSV